MSLREEGGSDRQTGLRLREFSKSQAAEPRKSKELAETGAQAELSAAYQEPPKAREGDGG